MSIYVDVSSAVHGKAGLKRYAENLVRALRPLLGERLRLFQNSLGRRGPLPGFEDWPTAGVPWGYKPWRSLVAAGQWLHRPMNHLVPGAALFHATEHLLPPLADIPTVLTVHDLIFAHLPQHHKAMNRAYLRATMPMYARCASAVIAVSEATKTDLMTFYGLEPTSITVIPEAAEPRFRPQPPEVVERARARYGLPPRYVLAVGTIEPRKNLSRLVEALSRLRRDDPHLGLVVVGAKGWLYEQFFTRVEELGLQEAVLLPGYVPDEDLPAVFRAATVYVMASLYEGAGLPVLEAMACGAPVVSSRESSMPELGADVARYFNPYDVQQMTDVIGLVLNDDALRAQMAAAGPERAARFSWQRAARETLTVYRRVMH